MTTLWEPRIMNAPIHRFDLLISQTPAALPTILNTFADLALTPARVSTHNHKNSLQSVTIILRQLADQEVRAIEKSLRQSDLVRTVSLEHMLT